MIRYKRNAAKYPPNKYGDRVMITCKVFFAKIEKALKEEKLYLEPKLSLTFLAKHLGTNRTYLSQAFNSHDTNYWKYLNSLKIDHLISIIENEGLICHTEKELERIAVRSGFGSRRAMDKVLTKTIGKTISEIVKKGL